MRFFLNIFKREEANSHESRELITTITTQRHILLDIKSKCVSLVSAIRRESPRYAFFSDEKLLELSASVFHQTEFLAQLATIFPGVKEFQIERNQLLSGLESVSVVRVVTYYEEIILLRESIFMENNQWDEPPPVTIVKEIEVQLTNFLHH